MYKTYVLGISLLLVAIFAVAAVPGLQMSAQAQGVQYHSDVCVYKNDELIDCSHNILYNTGKELIEDLLGDNTGTSADYIQLCNATAGCGVPQADAGETYNALNACGLAQAQGIYNGGLTGSGNWSISQTFQASCDNVQTNVTRLRTSGGTNFAGNNFTLVTLQTDDIVNVTWTIWVT